MKLSSSADATGLIEDIDFFLGTNSTNYTTNDKKRNINRWYQKVVAIILESMDEWTFQEESATASLVADQQEYSFPTDILKIDRIEVTYDGSNWYKAEPFTRAEYSETSEAAAIADNFTSTEPFYNVRETDGTGYVELFPIPSSAVTNGLKIWYTKEITELSANADEPAFNEMFHRILSLGATYDWSIKEDLTKKAAALRTDINMMMEDLKKFYGSRQEDRHVRLRAASENYE